MKKTQESAENYLETILVLSQTQKNIRAIDIANKLGYSKPSVSVAMKNLREKNHIRVDAAGAITLTEAGRAIAQKIYSRHKLLSEWLVAIGVDEVTAAADACKMEHDISEQTFEALQRHIAGYASTPLVPRQKSNPTAD